MINPRYVDGLELRIKELTAERDAALVEASKYQEIARQYTELASKGIYYTIEELQQHDLMLKAEAAVKGWWACWDWVDSDDRDKPTLIPAANQYAARVKAGE